MTTSHHAPAREVFSPSRLLAIGQALAVLALVVFWAWAQHTQPAFGGKPFGVDAEAYWGTGLQHPYTGPSTGLPGAFLYSPAFLQAFAPLQLLPWDWFMLLWLGVQLTALAWLLTPLGALAVLAFPPITSEVLIGNIHILLALALVVSMRHPASWALALLTKPSLGVGLTWYVARREWSRAGIAIGATAAIGLISFVTAPGLWAEWYQRISATQTSSGPWWTAIFAVRLIGAFLISWYAGIRRRPAFLPIALYLALPIPWVEGLALLAAVPRLVRYQRLGDDA